MLVAIQGIEGSFHHIAAQKFFKRDFELELCLSFRDLVNKSIHQNVDFAIMAIENSIAGSILPNYSLLQASGLYIRGEIYLKISQHLLCNQFVEMGDLKEIHSHPMAILQCAEFIEKHPWKIVETEDTALSAKNLADTKQKQVAAIGSKLAASLFNLKIVQNDIHTLKNNSTRFLVLSKNKQDKFKIENKEKKKASLYFEVEDKKGSLGQVLAHFSYRDINLLKLQSSPVPGSEWRYYFHADLEFEKTEDFEKSFQEIQPITYESKIYGIYKKGGEYLS